MASRIFSRLFPALEILKPSHAKGPLSGAELAVLVFILLISTGYRMTLRLIGNRGKPSLRMNGPPTPR